MKVIFTEAVIQWCSLKEVFLEISQNSQENTCEFCEISKNTIFHKTPVLAVFIFKVFLSGPFTVESMCLSIKICM